MEDPRAELTESEDVAIEEGPHFEAVWLTCLLSGGMKASEVLVRVETGSKEPPAFYVARRLVRPDPTDRNEIPGQVKVTLLERRNGKSIVDVPGEPISFGPRLEVPSTLVKR